MDEISKLYEKHFRDSTGCEGANGENGGNQIYVDLGTNIPKWSVRTEQDLGKGISRVR